MSSHTDMRRDEAHHHVIFHGPRTASRLRSAVLATVVVAIGVAVQAQYQEYRSPIAFEATVAIEPGADFEMIAREAGLPIQYRGRIIPVGGVVTLSLDGDLVVSWNESQVGVGQVLDLTMSLEPGTRTKYGDVRASFAYLVQSSFVIDFDSLFHDTGNRWGVEVDLQDYPYLIYGRREVAVSEEPREVFVDVRDSLASASFELFLLNDAYVFTQQCVDTLPLSYSFEPYPCLRVSADGNIYTYFDYSIGIDDLCVRCAGPGDTLCWAGTKPTDCFTMATDEVILPDTILCEAVSDWVVPICPIAASGTANMSIRTDLEITSLSVRYTCNPPGDNLAKGDLPDIGNSAPAVQDTTWEVETGVSFDTDRDDCIFTLPVLLDSIIVLVISGTDTLGAGETVYDNSTYTVAWELDDALENCCNGSEQLQLIYRAMDVAHPDTACSEVITTETHDHTYTYTWHAGVGCAPSGTQDFRLIAELKCLGTGAVLYRATSQTFQYSK